MITAYKWTYDMANMTYGEAVPTLYWISPNGYNATGDGTNLLPWKTLSYACSQVTNIGAVIHVAPGTYTETAQSVLAPGVSIEGIGDTCIITSAAALNPIITASSAAGNAANGNQSISYLKLDGDLTALRSIDANFRSNVKIHHCTFVDFLYNGVRMNGTVSN